jgi:hypothetical protein
MENIFFVIIVLIFCFLMISEGFIWHKSLRKKNVVKREKQREKSSDSEIHMPEDLYWCKQWEHKCPAAH